MTVSGKHKTVNDKDSLQNLNLVCCTDIAFFAFFMEAKASAKRASSVRRMQWGELSSNIASL